MYATTRGADSRLNVELIILYCIVIFSKCPTAWLNFLVGEELLDLK